LETLVGLAPLLILFVLMWLLVIRPQQVQQRRRQEMLARLKRGDRVVTVGGIHGTVTLVDEHTVRLRIADGVEITLNKAGVGAVLEEGKD
jgi:preprotein translocase subunit YajC